MARSVSVPAHAVGVAYAVLPGENEDGDYEEGVNQIRSFLKSHYRTLRRVSTWIGREDRVILENEYALVGISEYCGLVALWVVPARTRKISVEKATNIAKSLSQAVGFMGEELVEVGTFSNGETIFRAAGGRGHERGDLGLGFSSKEGWI